MTAENDGRDELGDARVTRAYRELSNECTPPELDRAVLNEAASRVAPDRGGERTRFAPLAFAATLVLGVALLFEIQSETGPATQGTANGIAPPTPDRIDERSVRDVPASSEASRPSSQLNMPASVAAPDESPIAPPKQEGVPERTTRSGEALKTEAEAADHWIESGSDEARQSLQDFTSAVAESAAGLSQVSKRAASEANGDKRCSDEQTTDAAAWWRCVETLRSKGDTVAADQELQRLRERFPDFKPDS